MITKIINGKIIGDSIETDKSIYIGHGKILNVTSKALPFDIEYDAQGSYISAGFVDIHCHGGGGHDFMDGGSAPIIEGAKAHLRHGTTSIFPTTLSASEEALCRAVADIKEAMSFPTVRGAHLEGPYFNPECCGAQNTEYIRGFDFDEIEKLLDSGIIKRWDFAPELENSEKAAKMLSDAGVVAAIAHSNATYEQLLPAFREGCRLATHLYSAMSTVTRVGGYRHLGVVESAFLLDEMTVEVIADGCHLPPELLLMISKIKGADKICLVTDSMRAAGMPDGEYILGSKKEGILCVKEDGVAKLPDRSAFAGSCATADRLVRTAYKEAGIPLCDAVKMMTKTPAIIMGLDTKGDIREGFDADLAVFDEDINIKSVFVGGNKLV